MNEIQEMRREGLTISKISALTGFDRKTVRKYLSERSAPVYGPRKPRRRVLDRWSVFIEQRLAAGIWNARVLHRQMRDAGLTGGYTVVKDHLAPLRKEAARVAQGWRRRVGTQFRGGTTTSAIINQARAASRHRLGWLHAARWRPGERTARVWSGEAGRFRKNATQCLADVAGGIVDTADERCDNT